MQITPPVVSSVIPLCKVGFDHSGDKLISLLEATGAACKNVDTKYVTEARNRDPEARTALAVLPIYQDGRRGCFFDAASNSTFSASDLVESIDYLDKDRESSGPYGAFLFGYPHLLPMMQGEALAHIFTKARATMKDGGIVALDLNGVPGQSDKSTPWGSMCSVPSLKAEKVIGPALSHVDILHMNEDELVSLTGIQLEGTTESLENDDQALSAATSLFLECGVAVVAVTRGKKGCFIKCNTKERFASSKML